MFEFLKKLVKKKPKPKKVVAKPAPKPKKVVAKPAPKPKKVPENDLIAKKNSLPEDEPFQKKKGFFNFTKKIKEGLAKTREKLTTPLSELFSSQKIDESFYDELEMILLTSDVGISATEYLILRVKEAVSKNNIVEPRDLKQILKDELVELLQVVEKPISISENSPHVIMMVGVNGTGKTTTIGKLTKHLSDHNHSVLIAAGDTFRAAAAEQLKVWGDRNSVTVISQETGDPSAVVFDAINSAKAKNIDIAIADTAGRLPTQKHLIDEIAKIKKVMDKCHKGSPQEILLVIDANTGQNAINQLKIFNEALGITGLVITKLDGTAKGGVIAAIAKEIPTPVRFIGVGEGIDDLRIFNAKEYVDGMFA
jgi:fused signal recognition particle receptor